jgi:hypothetical protein
MMDYYGGAVAYGNPVSIGILGSTGELIQDQKTIGHVFFQEARAGAFAPADARVDLGRGKNDLLARRQIVADGDRPLVAFDDLNDVFVREYKGKGDIDDAANWTMSKFPGTDPSLAWGPHGTWPTYHPIGLAAKAVVVKLVDGHRSGPPPAYSCRSSKARKISSPRPLTVSWSPAGSRKTPMTTTIAA